MTKIANLAARIKAAGNPVDNEQVMAALFASVSFERVPDDEFKAAINSLLGSYFQNAIDLAKALDEPIDGTHAFTLIAETEKAHLDTMESLLSLTVATVLSNLIDQEGGGRVNMTISPKHMEDMLKRYTMEATRNGMETTVKLTPIPGAFDKLSDYFITMVDEDEEDPDNPDQRPAIEREIDAAEAQPDNLPPTAMHQEMSVSLLDVSDAKAQAAPKPERPLWAVRVEGELWPCSDKHQAESRVSRESAKDPEIVAQVENRFCYHDHCPAEHCNKTEVTSVDNRDA